MTMVSRVVVYGRKSPTDAENCVTTAENSYQPSLPEALYMAAHHSYRASEHGYLVTRIVVEPYVPASPLPDGR